MAKQVSARKIYAGGRDGDDQSPYDGEDFLGATEELDRAVGVAQHHDAITGTEQDQVASDYHRRLDAALYRWSYTAYEYHGQTQCKYLNMSTCDISGTWETTIPDQTFDVYVYNPQGRPATSFPRFSVPGPDWLVFDAKTEKRVNFQVLNLPEAVLKMPGRESF